MLTCVNSFLFNPGYFMILFCVQTQLYFVVKTALTRFTLDIFLIYLHWTPIIPSSISHDCWHTFPDGLKNRVLTEIFLCSFHNCRGSYSEPAYSVDPLFRLKQTRLHKFYSELCFWSLNCFVAYDWLQVFFFPVSWWEWLFFLLDEHFCLSFLIFAL